MIKDFVDGETEKVWRLSFSKRLPRDIQRQGRLKLMILDAALTIEQLRQPPSNRLEKLAGEREGQHSIRINDQWRVCFEWRDGNAFDVEIVDYH